MGKGYIFSDYHSFYLEEFGFMRHIGRFVTKHFSHHNHTIRRYYARFDLRFHISDLHVRCVSTQNISRFVFHKEGVLHISSGMIFFEIKRVEVVPFALKQWPFGKGKAHFIENTVRLAYK